MNLDNKLERGSFILLVDKKLGMVICSWKEYKVLKTVSTIMELGCQEVQRIKVHMYYLLGVLMTLWNIRKVYMVCIDATIIELLGRYFPIFPIYENSIKDFAGNI